MGIKSNASRSGVGHRGVSGKPTNPVIHYRKGGVFSDAMAGPECGRKNYKYCAFVWSDVTCKACLTHKP